MALGQITGNGMYAKPNFNGAKYDTSLPHHHKMNSCKEKSLYSNLTRYSNEKCKYCCRLFFNKLQLFMHNTRHMYIPVEKLELSESIIESLKISQNLVPETTEESQNTQIINIEETVVNKPIKNVGFKKMLSKTYKKFQETKEKSVDSELDIRIQNHKDNLLKDLMTDCKVNLGENIPIPFDNVNTRMEQNTTKTTDPEKYILSNFTSNCMVNLNDLFTELQTDVGHIKKDLNSEMDIQAESSIKITNTLQTTSRNNSLLNRDVVKERKKCEKKNYELNKSASQTGMNMESAHNESKELSLNNNMLIVGKKLNNPSIHEVETKFKERNVSYHILVKDKIKGVGCRICHQQFKNRYQAIIHESCHLLLRIPRIDIYLKNKPGNTYHHQCYCLQIFPSLKQYLKHIKKCSKQTLLPNPNSKGAKKIKIKKERQKKERKKLDKRKVYRNLFSRPEEVNNYCPYCKSDSAECTDQCSEIRSDMMQSGNSAYFCKECYTKMEVNLTKCGLYNGQSTRRCVVCNGVGMRFVLAFMTAECVLGI